MFNNKVPNVRNSEDLNQTTLPCSPIRSYTVPGLISHYTQCAQVVETQITPYVNAVRSDCTPISNLDHFICCAQSATTQTRSYTVQKDGKSMRLSAVSPVLPWALPHY